MNKKKPGFASKIDRTQAKRYLPLFFLFVFSLIIRLYYAWKPLEILINQGMSDDAFYYLTIARNFSQNFIPSFDGLSPTNGFHPLYLLLITPLFWLFPQSPELIPKLAISLLMICATLTGIPIYTAIRKIASHSAGFFAAFLWYMNPWAFFFLLGGVETAVYTLLAALTICAYLTVWTATRTMVRAWLLVGILMGLTLLARSDAIFLMVALLFDITWSALMDVRANHRGIFRSSLIRMGAFLIGCSLLFLPWVMWNLITFGTFFQVSGMAIHWHTHFGVSSAAETLAKLWPSLIRSVFGAILFTSQVILLAFILVIVKILLARSRSRARGNSGNPHMVRLLRILAIYSGLILAFYGGILWQHQYWYFAPIMLSSALIGGLLYARIGELTVGTRYPFSHIMNGTAILAIAMIGISIWWSWQNGRLAIYPAQRSAPGLATLINEITPSTARIGAWNSGILGYLSDRKIINLDGVVNNDLYLFVRTQDVSFFDLCAIWPYIQENHIDFITDYEDLWSENMLSQFDDRLKITREIQSAEKALPYPLVVFQVIHRDQPLSTDHCPGALKVVK